MNLNYRSQLPSPLYLEHLTHLWNKAKIILPSRFVRRIHGDRAFSNAKKKHSKELQRNIFYCFISFFKYILSEMLYLQLDQPKVILVWGNRKLGC